ncbi:L,D-transpeptidase [Microvirga makkahensis]|uniref:L,D-transpeptidase family protein n=1 Tax=Microvirga makkahensis TaxID=1128670 RepID=A0A7X3MU31_9HYPH|nr:L,D-transpeptidase [Microvirga makkahensis]MXQ13222.1 L,D-transpeptidase family protein [Microvirga makkahensis]
MRAWISFVCLSLGAHALSSPATSAEVSILVNKTTQRMTVSVDGVQRYSWPVSTGMSQYSTPTGAFTPSRLAKVHYSREWDDAPMPHSIFFTDSGHAIHGSNVTRRLGSPASHGCIRLAPANARLLFDLVQSEGAANTRIEITGVDPIGTIVGSGNESGLDYSRLTSFDPLTNGIIASGPPHLRPERQR